MTTATETRSLKMHNKLLLDVIKRQAGSLEKAVLEGVMNAIEANASIVNIHFNTNDVETNEPGAELIIMDDGEGIGSIDEIHRFFETFGQPHDESENKTWAQFRMGRGQLFSFGKNTWRTSTFRMLVDIDKMGLDYHLDQELEEYSGCQIVIELYENSIGTFGYRSVDALKDRIATLVKFMPGKIFFDGEQINTPAEECSWDLETDEAYYLFGAGIDLKIYNLGAFTTALDLARAGTCGVIVSKKQLKVNFARNDIQHDCPVYPHIQHVIQQNRIKKTRRQNRISNEFERMSILLDLRDGNQIYHDVKTLGLIRDTSGRLYKLEDIRKNRTPWSFAERGDRRADKILQAESALVLDDCVLSELNYTGNPNKLFTWLAEKAEYGKKFHKGDYEKKMEKAWKSLEQLYKTFDDLAGSMSNSYKSIPEKQLTPAEKRILTILQKFNWADRTVCIGASDAADAWTDGRTHITVARSFLKRLCFTSPSSAAELVMVMIHEMAHDDDDKGSHNHDEEFYRRFHDLCLQRNSQASLIADMLYYLKQAKINEKVAKYTAKTEKAEKNLQKKISARKVTTTNEDDDGIEEEF